MIFERSLKKFGNSIGVIIPPDIIKYLDVEVDTEIVLEVKEGKFGKYVAFWKKVDDNNEQI